VLLLAWRVKQRGHEGNLRSRMRDEPFRFGVTVPAPNDAAWGETPLPTRWVPSIGAAVITID